jgi:hypothetical protein
VSFSVDLFRLASWPLITDWLQQADWSGVAHLEEAVDSLAWGDLGVSNARSKHFRASKFLSIVTRTALDVSQLTTQSDRGK